jgi:hypothetical protein
MALADREEHKLVGTRGRFHPANRFSILIEILRDLILEKPS